MALVQTPLRDIAKMVRSKNVLGNEQEAWLKDKLQASFKLKAASVTNPFNLGLYSSFRCPAAL